MTNITFTAVLILVLICASPYSSSAASEVEVSEKMGGGLVDYNEVLKAQKDDSMLIIDIRENSEIQETGKLPGSIHIPMGEVVHELSLSSEEFETKYGKKKPSPDTIIITSCRSGRRSKMIIPDLEKAGYENVFSYSGGWLDWVEQQKN